MRPVPTILVLAAVLLAGAVVFRGDASLRARGPSAPAPAPSGEPTPSAPAPSAPAPPAPESVPASAAEGDAAPAAGIGAATEDAEPSSPGITGTVLDPRGDPVPGAVVAYGASEAIAARGEVARTDDAGRFRIPGFSPKGGWRRLYAFGPGIGLGISRPVRPRELPDGAEVELRLEAGGTLAGRVLEAGGRPVAGAALVLSGAHRRHRLRLAGVRSGTDGAFRFEGLPAGEWEVAATAPGFAPAAVEGVTVRPSETARADLFLDRGRTLAGRVVDGRGDPVAGAEVRVRPRGFPVPGVGEVRVETDGAGAFEAGPLPGERFEVRVSRDGIAGLRERDVRWTPNGLRLVVERRGAVRGRTRLAAGAAAPDRITIYAVPPGMEPPFPTWTSGILHSRTVDGPGEYRIAGIRPGTWDVVVLARGCRPDRVRGVRVDGGGEARVDLVLRPDGR